MPGSLDDDDPVERSDGWIGFEFRESEDLNWIWGVSPDSAGEIAISALVLEGGGCEWSVRRVRGLRMRYGQHDVLAGVDVDVHRSEVVVLLGPNGAGKTTTIEILEGFRRPSAGSIEVLGTDPLHAGEAWRARVGVVLQSWRDHARWTPGDLIDHLGAYYTPFASEGRPRPIPTDEQLDMVGLASAANQRIITLSGGQRRRPDVAVGIVGRPELLFLDEPTAGFDPQAKREFHELVRTHQDGGVAGAPMSLAPEVA